MSYKNWSALDMVLVLELALLKDGDKHENVLCSLKNLASPDKTWKRGDESLPEYCTMLAQLPDPVKSVRDVCSNFYRQLKQVDVFEVVSTVPAELTADELEEFAQAHRELIINDRLRRPEMV